MAPRVSIIDPGPPGPAGMAEPWFVSEASPDAGSATWAVLVHAPGENRTGNNYWQVEAARALAAAGVRTVRFDLSGHGESLGPKDAERWLDQVAAAVALAGRSGARRVLLAVRGLHVALLGEMAAMPDVPVTRVALFPPPPAALSWWTGRSVAVPPPRRDDDAEGPVEADPSDTSQAAFWSACGAEPNLVGGAVLPRPLLDRLTGRLTLDWARPSWDYAITTEAWRDDTPGVHAVIGDDPLARRMQDRTELVGALVTLAAAPPGRRRAREEEH